MALHIVRLNGALVVTLVLAGCERGAPNGDLPSPVLVPIDSIVLAETEAVYIGRAGNILIPPDGSYLIGDGGNATIHHYSADGKYLHAIGRKGEGPGEFKRGPGSMAIDADSLMVTQSTEKVQAFDYKTGAFKSSRVLTAPFFNNIAAHDGRLYFQFLDHARKTTVGILNPGSDSIQRTGPYPKPLGEFPPLDQTHTSLLVAPLADDSIAVAMQRTDEIYIGSVATGVFEAIPIAILHRSGSQQEMLAGLLAHPDDVKPEEIYKPSMPTTLTRLSSGRFAHITSDHRLLTNPTRFAATMYLSIVDPKSRRTCPDARIPVPDDPQPHARFRGDTLVVLNQEISDAGSRTRIRRYLVDTADCKWIAASKEN